jgi:hypothetical protein
MLPETGAATRMAHHNPFWRGIGLHSYDKIADQADLACWLWPATVTQRDWYVRARAS